MDIYIDYVSTSMFWYANLIIIPIILLKIRNTINKSSDVSTGKFFVKGKVTYSECSMFAENLDLNEEAYITYSYSVDGVGYQGSVKKKVGVFNEKYRQLVEKYPIGSEVPVYYSKRNPGESYIDSPPTVFGYYREKAYFAFLLFSLAHLLLMPVSWLVESVL